MDTLPGGAGASRSVPRLTHAKIEKGLQTFTTWESSSWSLVHAWGAIINTIKIRLHPNGVSRRDPLAINDEEGLGKRKKLGDMSDMTCVGLTTVIDNV